MRWQNLRRHLYGTSQGRSQASEANRVAAMRIPYAAAAPVHAWLAISYQDRPLCQHKRPQLGSKRVVRPYSE